MTDTIHVRTARRGGAIARLGIMATAAAVLLGATEAQAATITLTDSFSLNYSLSGSGGSNTSTTTQQTYTDALTFAMFDTTLGTLTSVDVTFDSTATLSAGVTGQIPNAQARQASATGQVDLSATLVPANAVATVLAQASCTTSAGGCTGTATDVETLGFTQQYTGSGVSPFIGSGTFLIDLDALAKLTLASGAAVSVTGTTAGTWSGTGMVVYTYTPFTTTQPPAPAPVPEPGTLLLMGAGLGMTSLARRYRRSKTS